jgi:hypothetical protein
MENILASSRVILVGTGRGKVTALTDMKIIYQHNIQQSVIPL